MGGPQCSVQHDHHLPRDILHCNQDKRGCDAVDPRIHSQEENATKEWESNDHGCAIWSHPVPFIEGLRCRCWQEVGEESSIIGDYSQLAHAFAYL